MKIADTDTEKQQKRLLNSLTSVAPLPALQAYQQVQIVQYCTCVKLLYVLIHVVVTEAADAAAVGRGYPISR